MRIISGIARGLKLVSPDGLDTRPTLDRVKEAVFSMLLPYIMDSTVLDLFAGSGALGIEAVSRGAKKAVFVDNNPKSIECVKKNLTNAKFNDCAVIHTSDAIDYINTTNEKFDLIFLDPPYHGGMYEKVLMLIEKNGILADSGLIIAEWDCEHRFTDDLFSYEIVKEKKYGKVCVTVLKRRQV